MSARWAARSGARGGSSQAVLRRAQLVLRRATMKMPPPPPQRLRLLLPPLPPPPLPPLPPLLLRRVPLNPAKTAVRLLAPASWSRHPEAVVAPAAAQSAAGVGRAHPAVDALSLRRFVADGEDLVRTQEARCAAVACRVDRATVHVMPAQKRGCGWPRCAQAIRGAPHGSDVA